MNSEVLFEKKDNKMVITIDKNADYADIKSRITTILEASADIFDGVEEPIVIRGKRLSDFEEAELLKIFSAKTELEIVIEKPKKLGVATIDSIFNKDTSISNAKVFEGTVRSGQRVEFEGTIIILGDVNGGSEVVAEQNIIVLGDIRGYIHAGAKGNRSAFVAANSINPTQLRIADLSFKPENRVEVGNGYEIARVQMGEISIEA
jgi:septum site-determining protein MinC